MWQQSIYGFRYIWEHPGLRGLTAIFFVFFVTEAFGFPSQSPMILIRTDNNDAVLGIVRS